MKIHLRKKKLSTGKTSLYLEYYKGHKTDIKGKIKHIRDFEYLDLYLICNPITPQEIKSNNEKLELAKKILAIRKAEVYQGKYKINDRTKGKVTVLDYYSKLMEERYETKANYDNWDAAYKHLKKYCPKSLAT